MHEYYPLLILGAIIGAMTIIVVLAYVFMKDKKTAIGFDRNMKDTEIIRRIAKYAKPYISQFIIIILLLLFSISYDIISPMLVGEIELLISDDFEMKTLLSYVAVYASILIVSLVCTYLQAIILQKVGQKMLSDIRHDVFVHIESLSHSQLNNIPVGTLVTRVANDTGSISMMFTRVLVNLFKNVLVIFGVLTAMMLLNYMLTLVVLCFVPFVILFTVIFRKFSRRAYRKVKDGNTAINVFLSENLSGIKVTQIFNREAKKMEEFDKRNETLYGAKMHQIFVMSIFRPTVYMLYISSLLCLFYFGAKGIINEVTFLGQTINSGIIVSFYMYVNKFFNPIQSLAEQFNILQGAFASSEKIFTILDMKPTVVDDEGAVEVDEIKGDIEFKNVWFAYNDEDWVLKDVSFKIKAGQTVAFVGSTGSGKTTILSLICRNYDIQKGEILIDGRNIRDIKISSLRSHFGQMLQDVFLFAGTIKDNITLGDDSITDKEVEEACEYVNATHFIGKLKDGLMEQVRERGNNFSQGQRQLLSFARTIVHKPSVMILDEATANIDTETEVLIQDSLEKMMNIGTMLMVAHRLSTIQHADNIIVLSHGEIVEMGNHFELLSKRGRYYNLYTLQFRKNQLQGKQA